MGNDVISSFVLLAFMFVMLYFFWIRPDSKRRKEAQAMRDSLNEGDEVTTIGGITGTICKVKENTVVIETGADRVRLEITKWSISSKGTQVVENTK